MPHRLNRYKYFVSISLSFITSIIAFSQSPPPYVKGHSFLSAENLSFLNTQAQSQFHLGVGLCGMGDIDGNGAPDIAMSSTTTNGGKGEVYILLFNTDGSVASHQIINETSNNGPPLINDDHFGARLANVGDVDGDGVNDMAVLASDDDQAGSDLGAIYVLFLNSDGSLKDHSKIVAGATGYGDTYNLDQTFLNMTGPGDMDNDGIPDLVVGSPNADIGGSNRGMIRCLFLNADGSVKNYKKISSTSNWAGSPLSNNAYFGFDVASMGDLNGDGNADLAVTAKNYQQGTVFILFMDGTGSVSSYKKINNSNINTDIAWPAQFGWAIDNLGDINGDGVNDLLSTARFGHSAHYRDGKAVIVYLNSDGSVLGENVLGENQSPEQAGMGLHDNAYLGQSAATLGDIDGDGMMDIALASIKHDGGGGAGANWGRVYIMNLQSALLADPIPIYYSKLSRKLNNLALVNEEQNKNLNFRYDSRHSNNNGLDYVIYNDDHIDVSLNTTIDTDQVSLGTNMYTLNVENLLEGYYVLEVQENPGEKLYLRFQIEY